MSSISLSFYANIKLWTPSHALSISTLYYFTSGQICFQHPSYFESLVRLKVATHLLSVVGASIGQVRLTQHSFWFVVIELCNSLPGPSCHAHIDLFVYCVFFSVYRQIQRNFHFGRPHYCSCLASKPVWSTFVFPNVNSILFFAIQFTGSHLAHIGVACALGCYWILVLAPLLSLLV